jgi:hypothetical protein
MDAHTLTHTHIMHRTAYKGADRQEGEAEEQKEADEEEARQLVAGLLNRSR